MADRLNKPLDAIIADSERNQRRRDGRAGGIRGSQGARNNRKSEPYDSRRPARDSSRVPRSSEGSQPYECAMKVLLDNNLSGSFIGNAGFAIQDLIEITGASIHISGTANPYPGTNERVVFITGSESSVGLAQGLIWEMIGQQTQSIKAGLQIVWNPAAAKASPGEYDEEDVQLRIVIPAASAGRVLGKGGNVFRKLTTDSGVETSMSSVEDADLLQERVITISGTVGGCMDFTAKLLAKLMEVPDGCQYVYSGTAYPRSLAGSSSGAASGRGHSAGDSGRGERGERSTSRRNVMDDISLTRPEGRSGGRGAGAFSKGSIGGAETLSANTTIELAVPNHLVGAILGVQGAKLAEINALSGARVKVSNKNEYVEGTTNRLVTIVGSPICAQTAHTLVVHKIQQELLNKSD